MAYKNKEDQAKAARRHYLKNKDLIRKRAIVYTTANRKRIAEYVRIKKDAPCKDCGQKFHHSAMDFDHINSDKHREVARMADYSVEKVQKEIDKCELVCANCHRVRTWTRRQLAKLSRIE